MDDFLISLSLSYFPSFVLLTPVFSGYSGHAERLSSAISFSLKLKSGKREHGDRLIGLITFTTMPKVTYVFVVELRRVVAESFGHRMRRMANTNIRKMVFLRTRTRIL